MVAIGQIEDFGKRVGTEFGAEKVILFGSYATGNPTEDSDVDLFVVLPFEGRSVDQSVKMRLELRPEFPIDLIVRTPESVRRRLEMGDDFVRSVMEEGKVIYEANDH